VDEQPCCKVACLTENILLLITKTVRILSCVVQPTALSVVGELEAIRKGALVVSRHLPGGTE
jgi:hypothetical protein